MNYSIGIDIGATNIKGVLAVSNGKLLACFEIPTNPKRKKEKILKDIIKLINCLEREALIRKIKLEGVGIGIPGTLKQGKLVFGGGTLKQFIGVNFKKLIQERIGLKVILENDSACFTLAESIFGAGKNCRRVAGVIWGTGVGSGFFDKNKRSPMSLEMGHFVVESDIKSEPKDACGERGCVENLASGKNIFRRYYARGGKIKNADVREIYYSKEKAAKEVLEEAYRYLSIGIFALIKIVEPEIVVMGGGVSNLPESSHKKLRKYVYECSPQNFKKIKIVKSKLGNFAGALGAAMLILKG